MNRGSAVVSRRRMTDRPWNADRTAWRTGDRSARPVPSLMECGYYGLLCYAMLAPGLGILIPLAAGGMLLLLACFSVLHSGLSATVLSAPLRWPIACAASFLLIEVVFHGGSLADGVARPFVTWVLGLVVVHSLTRRPGFVHRCVLVLWVMGLTTVPYLIARGPATDPTSQRMAVDAEMIAGDFTNSNGLGGWFGFCAIYFTVVAVNAKKTRLLLGSCAAALGCLYIVGLTVSRGGLLGTALGMTIASRRILKRGFVPVLLVVMLAGLTYYSGAFDDITSRYLARGAEDTGRLQVWPATLQRFLDSPLLGVGADNVETYVPNSDRAIHPHNSFLWFAVASGVIPLVLFIGLWVRAARNAIAPEESPEAAFRAPFLAHTFVNTMIGDLGFMQPWGLVTLCLALTRQPRPRTRRVFVPHRSPRTRRPLVLARAPISTPRI